VLANRFGKYYADSGSKEISGRVIVSGQIGRQRVAAGASA